MTVTVAHVAIALENEPYPYDRRVRQEAETLRDAGHRVTVCGPTGFGHDALEEDVDGIRALRYRAPAGGQGAAGYVREYTLSLAHLGQLLRRVHRARPVDAVIACSPPDLLVLAARSLRRQGAALLFDHHDLSPELFVEKFDRRGPLHRALLAAERFALRSADVVLTTNDSYAQVARERGGVAAERIFVVRNGPDPARIHPVQADPALRRGRKHLVCWVGLMSSQEGLEVLIDAAAVLVRADAREDVGFAIVGPGDARASLERRVAERGLEDHMHFPGRVDDELLRRYMATADVCVSVDAPSPMNHASTMTKVIEYMVMGRPIVQFALRETERVCGDSTLYARAGDSRDLASRIAELLEDPARAAELGHRARERALAGLLWPQQAPVLLEALDAALDHAAARVAAGA
ncbi:MAG: glycosyltransferase family 4 protein [Solirubrobacteraceae bacterium]